MLVEATLDFPEEEIDFLQRADARAGSRGCARTSTALLAQSRQGAVLREGLNVVLVGAPNVGKSSLLNALAGAEVAIVTAVPGTTRDRITQTISVDGIPLNIIDTAGLRTTADEVEKIGIERTLAELGRADAVLHLVDAMHPDRDEDVMRQVGARVGRGVRVLTVLNKIDLAGRPPQVDGERVWLSARTGAGVDLLRERAQAHRRLGTRHDRRDPDPGARAPGAGPRTRGRAPRTGGATCGPPGHDARPFRRGAAARR